MPTTSPNMSLREPADTDSYDEQYYDVYNYGLIDGHDHSSGKGVAVARGNAMTVTSGLTVSTGNLTVTAGTMVLSTNGDGLWGMDHDGTSRILVGTTGDNYHQINGGPNGIIFANAANSVRNAFLDDTGHWGIGTGASATYRMLIQGTTADSSASALRVVNSNGTGLIEARDDGYVFFANAAKYVNNAGDAYMRYFHTSDGANGIVQADNGSLYLRSSGGGNEIVMDTGSGGLNVSAGGITAASTIQANSGGIYSPSGWIAAGPVISGGAGDLNANRNNGTGYVFLANGSHYVGFDGSNYQMPTSGLVVGGGIIANAGSTIHGVLQVDTNLNADTITIDSGANSPGAKLAFPQTTGNKISLYDAGGGNFYGMGVNSSELFHCLPSGAGFTIRFGSGSGTIMWEMTGTGDVLSNSYINHKGYNSFGGYGALGTPASTVYAFQATNTGSSTGIANSWSTYSSEKFKADVRTMTDGVEAVKKLRPVHYTHKESGEAAIGLIAEEVAAVYPQVVVHEDGEPIAMDYGKLVTPILSAMLELVARVEALEAAK